MRISLRQAAAYLNVSEATVRRWIAQRGLPVHRSNERLYCNPIELWEWSLEHGVPASRSLLEHGRDDGDSVPTLVSLIRRGGLQRGLWGGTKSELLRAVVEVLPLPAEADREHLLMVLEAREAMGSTGLGDGIAIPHARNPILLPIDEPFLTLCLLRDGVDFDAIDGRPVHTLFVVVSPTVPAHLRILARLGFVLRDRALRGLLAERASDAAILDRIGALEGGATGAAGAGDQP